MVAVRNHFISQRSSARPLLMEKKPLIYKHLKYLKTEQARLALHSWVPDKVEYALFYIHGLQSHAAWSAESSYYFASKGIAVYILDRHGSGLSDGIPGDIPSTEMLMEDYGCALQYIKERHPSLPLTLLGQSLGGTILAGLLCWDGFQQAYDQLIFCASGLGRRHQQLSEAEYLRRMQEKSQNAVPINLSDYDMTDRPEFLHMMRNDSRCLRYITQRAYAVLLEVENLYWNQQGVIAHVPSAFVYPRHDPIVDTENALITFKQLTAGNGVQQEFAADKHYLWFTSQRYKLMDWLVRFIKSNG